MSERWMSRFNRVRGETGKGIGLGTLAGGFAGLLLGFTRSFNRRRQPGKAARVSFIGAAAGGAMGALIWKMPGHSGTVGQASSQESDRATGPAHWAIFREQIIELPETVEIMEVRKQARQAEEVMIRPVVTERVATVQDSVRHTELDIQQG